jgi:hypothetical protein
VYLFTVVLAFGMIWVLFGFGLDIYPETGVTMLLAQHGLDDTVIDMMHNSLGVLLVALFGQPISQVLLIRDWVWSPEA